MKRSHPDRKRMAVARAAMETRIAGVERAILAGEPLPPLPKLTNRRRAKA